MSEEAGRIRLDKWLWYARVTKTRSLAQKLVKSGKVRINKLRNDSPGSAVKPDDVLTITLERAIRVLKIKALGSRRGPASEAALLYEDLSPIVDSPDKAIQTIRIGARPTKKERRALDHWKSDIDPEI